MITFGVFATVVGLGLAFALALLVALRIGERVAGEHRAADREVRRMFAEAAADEPEFADEVRAAWEPQTFAELVAADESIDEWLRGQAEIDESVWLGRDRPTAPLFDWWHPSQGPRP